MIMLRCVYHIYTIEEVTTLHSFSLD